MEFLDRFGRNLRRAREAAGISQEALSSRAGLHRTVISDYELGKTDPQLGSVVKLAEALGTTASGLCEGIDLRQPAAAK